MRPYGVKVVECPDVEDIRGMGSKSCVGRISSQHGYIRKARAKAATRRYWARKARSQGRAEVASQAE